jgi:hypothetical protein
LQFLALTLILSPCGTALAQPAWYTPGVGGFNPNVPKFYQHQDYMAGGAPGANGWELGGGWCGWVAYDDIFYALAKQGYSGLYQGATDPTLNAGNNWYAATYGTSSGTDLYNVQLINNSGNPEDSLSLVFTGTGGSVNNLGTRPIPLPAASYPGFTPAGTTGTYNGTAGTSANGFTLNYTPSLANGALTAAFFTAIPGIQFNSGQWSSAANGNVNVDATRDKVILSEGPTNATVQSSDIYNLQQNLSFGDVRTYLNNNVNNNPANNGKLALWSGTWNVDGNGNVYYQSLQDGNVVNYSMFGISPVTFTRGVMVICNGQEVVKINQGNLNATFNGNGQGLWWAAATPAAAKAGNYHMLAVAGINVAANQLYVADPDTNPNTPAGPSGVAPTNGGWPSSNPNFPGNPGNAPPFNLKTPASASLPVPGAPVVGNANAASWNQFYTDFSFTPNQTGGVKGFNGSTTFDMVTSTQSTQYSPTPAIGQPQKGCGLANLQTIMKNPFTTVAAAGAGAGKEETAIAMTLPSDAEDAVDQILVEPSQQALDPASNAGLDSFTDPSEPSSTWGDVEDAADPFGNSLSDDGIDYDLTGGTGLEPGESATIDIGTDAEFANEGYDVLLHYEADADDPNGFWMPYMEEGSEIDASAAIGEDQDVPEPSSIGLVCLVATALLARRRRTAA